jgi:hypothetical protein
MHTTLQQLSGAAAGLLYLSETDAPLEPFGLTAAATNIEEALRISTGTDGPVEIQEVDYFFRNQVRADEAGSAEEQERARRFQTLVDLIHKLLPDAKVYRLGTIRISAYIIGTLSDGSKGGLKTILVET